MKELVGIRVCGRRGQSFCPKRSAEKWNGSHELRDGSVKHYWNRIGQWVQLSGCFDYVCPTNHVASLVLQLAPRLHVASPPCSHSVTCPFS
jgi:hypothetical protein